MKFRLSCGSALLLVFVISFVLSLAAMRCWHVSSLLCDVQHQREIFYRQFYTADRILNAGISLACQNFDRFLQLNGPTNIAMNSYLTEDEINKSNVATFTFSKVEKRADCLYLSASLVCKNELVCNLRCMLERKMHGNANKKALSFIVTHFTLGTSL